MCDSFFSGGNLKKWLFFLKKKRFTNVQISGEISMSKSLVLKHKIMKLINSNKSFPALPFSGFPFPNFFWKIHTIFNSVQIAQVVADPSSVHLWSWHWSLWDLTHSIKPSQTPAATAPNTKVRTAVGHVTIWALLRRHMESSAGTSATSSSYIVRPHLSLDHWRRW